MTRFLHAENKQFFRFGIFSEFFDFDRYQSNICVAIMEKMKPKTKQQITTTAIFIIESKICKFLSFIRLEPLSLSPPPTPPYSIFILTFIISSSIFFDYFSVTMHCILTHHILFTHDFYLYFRSITIFMLHPNKTKKSRRQYSVLWDSNFTCNSHSRIIVPQTHRALIHCTLS